jgi:hypothetical protein
MLAESKWTAYCVARLEKSGLDRSKPLKLTDVKETATDYVGQIQWKCNADVAEGLEFSSLKVRRLHASLSNDPGVISISDNKSSLVFL